MSNLELFFGFLYLFYLIGIVYLIYGLFKIKPFLSKKNQAQTTFSIVVPFRNEKDFLPKLLASIEKMNYPKSHFEVLLIDDCSDDGYQLLDYKFQIKLLKNTNKSLSPKKEAIQLGVQQAAMQWIITTDADCEVPENWLAVFNQFILEKNVEMIAAAVKISSKNTFLDAFQNLDFLSLQAATMGSFGIQKPFLCNGANFAYSKSFFMALNGFAGNEMLASGDDVFLLQKAILMAKNKVGFLLNKTAIVKTKPEASWAALLQQRIRWASKTGSFSSTFGKCIALLVFIGNFVFLFCIFLLISNQMSWLFFGILLVSKLAVETIYLLKTAHLVGVKLSHYLGSHLVYPFFTIYVAIFSQLKQYKWKGRRYSS